MMLSKREFIISIGCGAAVGLSGCQSGRSNHEEISTEEALTYADTDTSGGYHIQDGIFELKQGQWTAFEFDFMNAREVDLSLAAEEGHARVGLFPQVEFEERYRKNSGEPTPDLELTTDEQDGVVTSGRVSQAPRHMIVVDNTDYLGFEIDGDAIIHLSIGIPL